MIKKALFFTALLTTYSANCFDPYTAPSDPCEEFHCFANGYVKLECPNCHEFRLFPSEQFLIDRRIRLTEQEQRFMVQAISDYTGDIVPGRLCPFCGLKLPTIEDFK